LRSVKKVRTDVTSRFRLASPVTATVLGVLVVVLAAASVVLAAFIRQLTVLNVGPAANRPPSWLKPWSPLTSRCG